MLDVRGLKLKVVAGRFGLDPLAFPYLVSQVGFM